jgi:hypothetical protein
VRCVAPYSCRARLRSLSRAPGAHSRALAIARAGGVSLLLLLPLLLRGAHRFLRLMNEVLRRAAEYDGAVDVPIGSMSGFEGGALAADSTGVSPGCLLVEHPAGVAGRVGRRVLLVFNVDHAGKVSGLCVNRPTMLRLRDVRARAHAPAGAREEY